MKKMFREDKRQEHFEHHRLDWWNHHRRGGLRIMVFSILQQAPRNGAEIMNEMEIISHGHWRPSPGSIYPLLDQLAKEESIRKREDGKYEMTEKGKREFEWPYRMHTKQPRSAGSAIEEMSGNMSYLEDLKRMEPASINPYIDELKKIKDRLTTIIDPK
jgi:DNA-binding PadR family transcriptional regulator